MKQSAANNDIRRRARAYIEEQGITQAEFAHRLGKKSGSAWASQFFRGEFNRPSTLDAVEQLIARKQPATPRMSSFTSAAPPPPPPPSPPPPPPAEWPSARIAEELRATSKLLGMNGDESLLNIAATRLDVLNSTIATIRQLTRDRDD